MSRYQDFGIAGSDCSQDNIQESVDYEEDEEDSFEDSDDAEEDAECGVVGEAFEETGGTRRKRSVTDYTDGNPNTNPYFSNHIQLVSRTNYFLAINANKTVAGTDDKLDKNTHLKMISTGAPGHVKIKSILHNFYLAMNQRGRVYSTENDDDPNIIFIEGIEKNFYVTYTSRMYFEFKWRLGINVAGKVKNGKNTISKRKATHFIKRPI